MADLTTVEDLTARTGVTYAGADLVQVQAVLADVSAIIRARRPQIDAWITAAKIDPQVVKAVACQAAARYLNTRETGGLGVRSETHPEYAYTLTSAAANGLSLTDDELMLLTLPPAQAAFSIMPG